MNDKIKPKNESWGDTLKNAWERGKDTMRLAPLLDDFANIKQAQANLDNYIKQYNISENDILLHAQETTPKLEKIVEELQIMQQALYEIQKSGLRFSQSYLKEEKEKINSSLQKLEGWGFSIFNKTPNFLLPESVEDERVVLRSLQGHLTLIKNGLDALIDTKLPKNTPSNNSELNKILIDENNRFDKDVDIWEALSRAVKL